MTRDEHAAAAGRWAAEAEMARARIRLHVRQQSRHFYAGDSVAAGMHSRLEDGYRELLKYTRTLAERHQWRGGFSAGKVE